MYATIQFRLFPIRTNRIPTALERLTAVYARSHHSHVTPIVGCYLCLHNVPPSAGRARLGSLTPLINS
jgi:hypothetical protein